MAQDWGEGDAEGEKIRDRRAKRKAQRELKRNAKKVKEKFEEAFRGGVEALGNYCKAANQNLCFGMSAGEMTNTKFVWSDEIDDGSIFYDGESIDSGTYTAASIDRTNGVATVILYAGGLAMTGASSNMKYYSTALIHEYVHTSKLGSRLFKNWQTIKASYPRGTFTYETSPHEMVAFKFSELVME